MVMRPLNPLTKKTPLFNPHITLQNRLNNSSVGFEGSFATVADDVAIEVSLTQQIKVVKFYYTIGPRVNVYHSSSSISLSLHRLPLHPQQARRRHEHRTTDIHRRTIGR